MAEDSEFIEVKSIPGLGLLFKSDSSDPDRKRRKPHEKPTHRREAGEYFETILAAAKRSNETLIGRNMPFRVNVYKKDKEVLIDLIRLDSKVAVFQTTTRTITHQDFDTWIEDVAQIEGLFVDMQG